MMGGNKSGIPKIPTSTPVSLGHNPLQNINDNQIEFANVGRVTLNLLGRSSATGVSGIPWFAVFVREKKYVRHDLGDDDNHENGTTTTVATAPVAAPSQ